MKRKWLVLIAIVGLSSQSASSAQSLVLQTMMRQKLVHAQQMLEAVVTSDWVSLETHSRELQWMTSDARWTVLKHPEYARHSSAFIRAVDTLHAAAAQRDLDATPKAYAALTLQCVDCHRYLARQRIVQ